MDPRDRIMLRTLIAIAWYDGVLHPNERRMLEELIRTFTTTEDEEREFEAMLNSPHQADDLADFDSTALGEHDRQTVLNHAVVLASIDEMTTDEEALIGELAARMSVPPELEKKLIAGAKARAARLKRRSSLRAR